MTKFTSFSLVTAFLLSASFFSVQSAFADASCSALVADLTAWNNSSTPRERHYAAYTMSTSATPARWVGYMAGSLNNVGTGLASPAPADQYFSDRGSRVYGCTGFCLDAQPFSATKTDKTSIAISANGILTITLNTWGGATSSYNATCANGFLYATAGDAFHVLSFKKASMAIPQ